MGGGAGATGADRPGAAVPAASSPPRSTSSSSRRASTGRARRSGSFSSIAASAGTRVRDFSYGVGGSCTTFASVSMASPPENGARPSAAAYRVAPSPHRSAGGPASWPLMISGAMYDGDPTSSPVPVMVSSPAARAMPKSVSFTRPSVPSRMLPGLTSRWVIPAACAASSAPRTARPTVATRSGCSGPSSLITSASDRDGTSSMTTQGRASSSSTSKRVTTLGWPSRAIARASRSVRSQLTARSSGDRLPGSTTSFTATVRRRKVSSASHTAPIAPRPSTRSRW